MDSITRLDNRSLMSEGVNSSVQRPPGAPSTSGVKVSGDTISWPPGGWVEVQYASSYNTISEGGLSATVGPGTYNVINHTTGERFEGIVVGNDSERPQMAFARGLTSTEQLGAARTTSERLLGSDASSLNNTRSDSSSDQANVESEVTVTEETRPDNDGVEDFLSDERNTVGVGIGVGAIAAGVSLLGGPVGPTVLLADGVVIGGDLLLNRMNNTETVKTTTVVNADGSVTRTQTGDTKNQNNDPIQSTTTRTTTYDDGRQVVSRFDSMTGIERTTDTNEYGVTGVTVSRPDNEATNAPRTNTSYNEDGVETTTVTSPTGVTYGPAGTNGVEVAEPAVSTTANTRGTGSGNRNSENDTDNRGGGTGGGSFGDRTSEPGGMGGV